MVLFAYENCANDYTNTTYVILYITQMTSYTAEEKYKKIIEIEGSISMQS